MVAVALLLPLAKVLVDSFEMQPARERFMKHCARVRRYKHRDHLLFWTSFHVPGKAKSAPSGQRSCSSTEVHWQPSRASSIRHLDNVTVTYQSRPNISYFGRYTLSRGSCHDGGHGGVKATTDPD